MGQWRTHDSEEPGSAVSSQPQHQTPLRLELPTTPERRLPVDQPIRTHLHNQRPPTLSVRRVLAWTHRCLANLSPRGDSFAGMNKQTAVARVNKSSKCPNCGGQPLVPIVYGFPSEFMMQLSQRGVLELGGCVISGDDPSFRCPTCRHDVWRDGRTGRR
jgi:hypothetical protein